MRKSAAEAGLSRDTQIARYRISLFFAVGVEALNSQRQSCMSWFLNYQSKPDSELSKAAFLAAGKALFVAIDFEGTCKHVLRVFEITNYLQEKTGASILDLEAFTAVIKERFLHGTIKELGKDITEEHIAILERAKDARNFIAHEGAAYFDSTNQWLIIARLKTLREEVKHLTQGANLVSLWSYEIENKEPGPRRFFKEYPKTVDQWVFGHVVESIEKFSDHPKVKRAEEMLSEWSSK